MLRVDLPFPGYDRDAPTFHWKYDAMIESLISNNPPSSRRSKAESELSPADQSPSPAAPMIGHRMLSRAQRKDIKKVHVPKGIVMQYEGELVDFLDQLTLSDAKDDDEGNREIEGDIPAQPEESSTEDYNWVIIHSADVLDSKPTLAPKVQEQEQESNDNKKFMVEQPQLFLRWDIQDQFLRFVAHALCSFYGLVSFSKTSGDGKRLVYICHPTHLESIGQLTIASKSETTTTATTSHKPPKRQVTLEHIQELPLQELDQLWSKVEPVKVASCPRPEMTFFEYLYPSTRPLF
ncbi:hypothetical protein BGZ46_004293 [Entomortierella lignicola]|nr:hypothetical protein BGZ46_004293 [Entomortierella lignicola]